MKMFNTLFRYRWFYQQFKAILNREALNIQSTPVGHSMRQRCDDAAFSLPFRTWKQVFVSTWQELLSAPGKKLFQTIMIKNIFNRA